MPFVIKGNLWYINADAVAWLIVTILCAVAVN